MLWIIAAIWIAVVVFAIAACVIAGRADDQIEAWLAVPTDSDEPRCDMTGQPLSAREQFERECD